MVRRHVPAAKSKYRLLHGILAQEKILPYFAERDIDYNTELFVKELTKGMGTTNIKAVRSRWGTASLTHQASGENDVPGGSAGCQEDRGGRYHPWDKLCPGTSGHPVEEGLAADRIVISHCDALYNLNFERDLEIAGKAPTWPTITIGIRKALVSHALCHAGCKAGGTRAGIYRCRLLEAVSHFR